MLDKELFGKKLKQALQDKNMKQSELATAVSTSEANISNYARGNAFPPIDILSEIAKVLGVSLDWLCGVESKSDQDTCKTLGDIARVITGMLSWGTVEFSDKIVIESRFVGDPYDGGHHETIEETCPAIVFKSGEMRKFISDLLTMQKLLGNKTIDSEFYFRWRNDRIERLDSISTRTQDLLNMLFDEEDECETPT